MEMVRYGETCVKHMLPSGKSHFLFQCKFSVKQNLYLVDTCKGPVGVFLKKRV